MSNKNSFDINRRNQLLALKQMLIGMETSSNHDAESFALGLDQLLSAFNAMNATSKLSTLQLALASGQMGVAVANVLKQAMITALDLAISSIYENAGNKPLPSGHLGSTRRH